LTAVFYNCRPIHSGCFAVKSVNGSCLDIIFADFSGFHKRQQTGKQNINQEYAKRCKKPGQKPLSCQFDGNPLLSTYYKPVFVEHNYKKAEAVLSIQFIKSLSYFIFSFASAAG